MKSAIPPGKARRARDVVRLVTEAVRARSFDHASAAERRHRVRARLSAVLRHAASASAYYRDRCGDAIARALAAGSDDAFFEAFAALPALRKDDLADSFDVLCTDPEITLARVQALDREVPDGTGTITTARGTYNVKKTSGTSGKVVYQVDTLAVQKVVSTLLIARTLLRTLAHSGAIRTIVPYPKRAALVVFVHRGNRSVYQGATSAGAPAWVRLLLDIQIIGHDASLDEILARVDRLAPELVFGLPSRLEWLAKAQLAGRLHIAPAIVFVGGETLHASLREAYAAAWPQCKIVNTYGTTETKAIAVACPECGELHVCEDIVHLELLAPDGRPCREGEVAERVLASSLYNFTLPVLRYELGDAIELLPDAGCRWRTRRIRVRGREPAFLWVQDAGAWKPLNGRMLKEILSSLEGSVGFAVKHDAPGALDVTVVVANASTCDAASIEARRGLDRFAADHGCRVADVFPALVVRAIEADAWNRAGGKLNTIQSRVEPPELAS